MLNNKFKEQMAMFYKVSVNNTLPGVHQVDLVVLEKTVFHYDDILLGIIENFKNAKSVTMFFKLRKIPDDRP